MRAGCAPTVAGDVGVVVASNGRLLLQGFDYDRTAPKGSPVAIGRAPISDVSVGQPLASASRNGVILHINEPLENTELVWLDQSGRHRGKVPLPPARYEWGVASPNGKQLLVGKRESPTTVELWLVDLKSGQSRRFSEGSQSRFGGIPVWSPDGTRIAFSSNRTGRTNIYERLVNEAGEERLLYESDEQFKEVNAWSPDGKFLVFEQANNQRGWDLWLLPMDGKRSAVPYLASRFGEVGAEISPDGRWLVYMSDASGRPEVYVRAFPTPGAEYHVSDEPGRGVWSRDGREIFVYQNRGIWSVPVSTEPTFKAGTPRLLFKGNPRTLDIHPVPAADRFLEVREVGQTERATMTVDVNVAPPHSR